MLGLGMIVGLRSAQAPWFTRSEASQEDHMVRKVEVMAAKAGGVDGLDGLDREGLRFTHDMPLKEQMIFTGSSDWSPEQAEHYIDWRIQCVDSEIARLRQQLDDLIASRKRWLAVTGGRSKMFNNGSGNGNGNGHAPTTVS